MSLGKAGLGLSRVGLGLSEQCILTTPPMLCSSHIFLTQLYFSSGNLADCHNVTYVFFFARHLSLARAYVVQKQIFLVLNLYLEGREQ